MKNGKPHQKFSDPNWTAKGEKRAFVTLQGVKTLWFNTGTLCNIECANCYIESSPKNDRLSYITCAEVIDYLDQIITRDWPTKEIAFTGGEPFMNPEIIKIIRACLTRGYNVLVLTNAMQPMMRKTIQSELLKLRSEFGKNLTLRISLDHFKSKIHDQERGKGSYDITLNGMKWLRDNDFKIALAGRSDFTDNTQNSRDGYHALYTANNFLIDAYDPVQTILFPEMDKNIETPEITTSCWSILNKSPNDIMCATSRMIVKRKGEKKPVILACTLLPYTPEFELGSDLIDAEKTIKLNHPHCSKFCVLGGASCS